MEQVVKIEEIKKRFDSEWVLLAELQTDESFRLLAGRVVGHSRNRHDIDALAKTLNPGSFTILNFVDEPIIITRCLVGFLE